MQGRQQAQFSARAVPYAPKPRRWFDALMFAYCLVVALLLLAVLGMAVCTSFIKFWPYDLSLSACATTRYGLIDGGVIDDVLSTACEMAFAAAFFGTLVRLRRRLPAREDARRGRRCGPRSGCWPPMPMGVPGHGAGPRLHPLLQPPGQSAQRPVPAR